jgi:hypothetical protein
MLARNRLDYVFYFFLLTGMTIGQWRTSGTKATCCGVAFYCLAPWRLSSVGWQRHRIAASRPDQLLSIWQSRAENDDQILSTGAAYRVHPPEVFFLTRWLSLLFNIMNIAFIFSVIGANLFPPIASTPPALCRKPHFRHCEAADSENAPQESMA